MAPAKKPSVKKTAPSSKAASRSATDKANNAPSSSTAGKMARLKKMIGDIAIVHATEDAPIYTPQGSPNSKWLADIRILFLNAEGLDLLTDIFWERYTDKLPLQIGGMEVGAIPLVTAILTKATQLGLEGVNGFIIRKERKDHGRARRVEGILNKSPVVLVDDIINSGSSLEKCRVVLEAEGISKVEHAFVVIDFEGTRGMHWRQEHNVKLEYLFKLEEFGLSIKNTQIRTATQQSYRPSWRSSVKGANPFYILPKSGPLVVGDKVFMGTDAALYLAFDAKTGKEIWRFTCTGSNLKGIFSTAAYFNGRLYFGAYNGNLYCLDAETGQQIWMQQLCEWIGSSPLIVPEHGQLYVGLEYARPRTQGSMASFNLETGERVWEVWTKLYQHGSAAYDAANDNVIFGTNDYTVTALKAKSGEKVWEVNVRNAVKYAPAVNEARGLVAFTSHDNSIYILESKTGKRVAEFPTGNQCYSTPLFHGNRLFVTSGDRHLYIINLDTMELEKKIDCSARMFASPRFIAPGTIAVGTTGGRMLEVDLETLNISGNVYVPDCITNAIAATPDGTMVYISTYMNELFAYHRTNVTRQLPPPPPAQDLPEKR